MGQQLFRPAPPRGRPYLAVEGHGTTYNAGPTKDVGRPEPVLFNRGEGAFSPPPPHEPNLNQPVNKGMSLNLLPIISAPAQVAGRLKYFQNNWHLISDDPWVLETITGYKIEFHSMPHQIAWPHIFVSTAQQEAVQAEKDKMALQGAIHPVSSNTEGGFHQQYISSRQGRWPPPGYKPKESEFLCALPAFQNAGNSHVMGPVKKKGISWSNWT